MSTITQPGPQVADGVAILNSQQLAAHVGVQSRTVVKWLHRGRFGRAPGVYRLEGKRGPWRITAQAVADYDARTVTDR